MSFRKEVIAGWSELSDQQRNDFAALADVVVGGEQRKGDIEALCQRSQRFRWVGRFEAEEGEAAVTRVETDFIIGGEATAVCMLRASSLAITMVPTWAWHPLLAR